jgi:hypothetical protein
MPADEPRPRWVVPDLIAALDSGIAARLLAVHPAAGWCRACRSVAPCSTRSLAEAAGASPRRSHPS